MKVHIKAIHSHRLDSTIDRQKLMETVQGTTEGALSVESLNKHDEKFRRLSRVTEKPADIAELGSQQSGRAGVAPSATTTPMMEKLRGLRASTSSGNGTRDKSDNASTVSGGGGGPTPALGLKSLLMVKRKMKGWKQSRMSRVSLGSRGKPPVAMENTFKMSPDDVTKFNYVKVKAAMEAGVRFFVNDKTKYEPKKCAQVSKIMAEDIKGRIKDLNFKRYKVVCNVVMGQVSGQAMEVASRCVWDNNSDNFVSYTFQNSSIFCIVSVYGVYFE